MTISTDNPGESVALADADPGAPSPASGFSLKVGDFEGPFDLLLSLIAKHKLEVTELALHEVTDEFIAYIKAKGSDWDLDEASSFLVVAATLLDLKAARLLPSGEVEDEEDLALLEARDLLFARLLQYRAYKQVAGLLADQMDNASKRIPRSVTLEPQFAALLPEVLIGLGAEQFAAMAALAMAPKEAERLGHLRAQGERAGAGCRDRVSPSALTNVHVPCAVADADSLLIVVGRFLALLELYREHVVLFDQVAPLGDLTIRWVGSEEGDVDVTDEFDVERDVDQQQQEASLAQDGPERNDR